MALLRPMRWPDDRESLRALDTSFTTDRILRLERRERAFVLQERPVAPPVRKAYPLAEEIDSLPSFDWARIAVDGGEPVGLATLRLETWNRRANLHHLYLAPAARGQGLGRALVEAAASAAAALGARCLWVETQTINAGAIRFYERVGFVWCGLDVSLYDPNAVGDEEVALFFIRPVP